MQVVHTVADLRAALSEADRSAFVPTMGNLHAGHVSLVELAKRHGGPVVASIFVNPLQFGAGEDFERYPRTLAADCDKLAEAGCDLVFAPDTSALYPVAQTFRVDVPAALAEDLCGAFRPGHFAGVATVVLKLFNLVRPQVAVFGRKDYQQLLVVREMVRQFNLPIDIVAGATLRDPDGLAMSSRNGYLSAAERAQAPQLQRELAAIVAAIDGGARNFAALAAAARQRLTGAGWRVDYVEIRDAESLKTATQETEALVVLAAAWLGQTRLIDNLEVTSAAGIAA
ncbi:pantoate-beta-alanine ligase [Thiobacillus denitrificans ATCC 25259]|uniref:Pantothenate synthetase n=1 Tax=Thiobacillus denitrificans (strain ATCC 25259 / T1) TaxID=292415 RepID=PANC_THIDA|nr:pantoate--beta-alanine ligase [Thiobacillus denitrificans]Q3SH82.1 RecName: Full=Pantothenate synthetase; Short=PS; AltName: Full=Pantoate--beta-alanine ligase; AltName: Full=Pantoate-activating enzyme [Thiobacillus denitrificans ATCC 25259]AAZ98007.1 pantoate-beta-alanine ligase [Thiobacillus denitrificans ATCC 25259]